VNKEIAGDAGAVFLPAAPARENFCVEGALGNGALARCPNREFAGAIRRRRILPGPQASLRAERAFDKIEIADDAGGEELFGFGAEERS